MGLGHPHLFLCFSSSDRPIFLKFLKKKRKCQILFLPFKWTNPLHVRLFGAYALAFYSKYFIVQRDIKSIFSVPAHCQNLNILNRSRTIQQLETISDNVLTVYSRSKVTQLISRFNTLHAGSLFKVYMQMRSWRSWFTPISCHGVYPLALSYI